MALEAVKVKIQEIFDEILVTTVMEGKDIVIRIALPPEIMNKTQTEIFKKSYPPGEPDLDKEAQQAQKDILGDNT